MWTEQVAPLSLVRKKQAYGCGLTIRCTIPLSNTSLFCIWLKVEQWVPKISAVSPYLVSGLELRSYFLSGTWLKVVEWVLPDISLTLEPWVPVCYKPGIFQTRCSQGFYTKILVADWIVNWVTLFVTTFEQWVEELVLVWYPADIFAMLLCPVRILSELSIQSLSDIWLIFEHLVPVWLQPGPSVTVDMYDSIYVWQ